MILFTFTGILTGLGTIIVLTLLIRKLRYGIAGNLPNALELVGSAVWERSQEVRI